MNASQARPRHTLVILDMQTAFVSPDGPSANTVADSVVAGVNELSRICRDHGVAVIHSRYTLRDDLRDAGLLAGIPLVAEGHLCTSAPGSQIDPRVTVANTDIVVEHHRPSGFFESDLDSVLRSLGTEVVILAGVSVNNAVGATARDAFARDLPAVIARQTVGCAPGEDHADLYIEALGRWTAEVVDLDQVASRL